MRAKIIADIAVVAVGALLWRWWMDNVPWRGAPRDLTEVQAIAAIFAQVCVMVLLVISASAVITWIHKGK